MRNCSNGNWNGNGKTKDLSHKHCCLQMEIKNLFLRRKINFYQKLELQVSNKICQKIEKIQIHGKAFFKKLKEAFKNIG